MKESEKKVIGQEVEAYDDKHKKIRMRNISIAVMAVVVGVGVGLGLRQYGHAVTDGDVDGLVPETTVEDAGTVSAGDAETTAAVTDLTYIQTDREYTDDNITITVSYTSDAMIPDQAEMTVEKLTGTAYEAALAEAAANRSDGAEYDAETALVYSISFLYDNAGLVPETPLEVTFAYADGTYEDGTVLAVATADETLDDVEISGNTFTVAEFTAPTTLVVGELVEEELEFTEEMDPLPEEDLLSEEDPLSEEDSLPEDETEFTYNETTKSCENSEVKITVTYTETAQIPDQAQLKARKLTGDELAQYIASAEAALTDGEHMIESLTTAYDITFVYNDEEIEPADTVNVTFAFKDGIYDDGEDLTVVHLGDEQTDVFNDVAVEDGQASVDLGSFSVTVVSVTGQDITSSVYDVKFQKEWEDLTDGDTYTVTDYAQVTFKFKNVTLNEDSDGNIIQTAYVKLDGDLMSQIKLVSESAVAFYNNGYVDNNGNKKAAGTFQIVQDSSGQYYAVFSFTDEFIAWYKDNTTNIIDGSAGFNYTWVEKEITEGGEQVTITIGNQSDTVYVNKNTVPSAYNVSKYSYTTSDYNKDTKEVTVHWELKVEVQNSTWTDGKIVITDAPYLGKDITLTGWTATSNVSGVTAPDSTNNSGYVTLGNGTTDGTYTITLGDADGVLPCTYIIKYDTTYTAEELKDITKLENAISWDGGSDKGKKDVTKTAVSKSGTVLNDNSYNTDGTVQWTVTVNGGSDYYYLDNESFSDTIESNNVLLNSAGETAADGDASGITIYRYEPGSDIATDVSNLAVYKNGTITAELNENGFYKYVITYKTKSTNSTDTEIPVSNTATVTGDVNGNATGNVEIHKPRITKKVGTISLADSSTQTYSVPWTVYINGGVTTGETHTDSVCLWNSVWTLEDIDSVLTFSGLTVTSKSEDEDGTVTTTTYVENTDYKITSTSVSAAVNGATGVFQIEFLKDIPANIEINYTFTVDADNISTGFYIQNYFDTNSDGYHYKEKEWASDTLTKTTLTDATLGLSRTIKWNIEAKLGEVVTTDPEFVDFIPAGLEFDEESLTIYVSFENNYWIPALTDSASYEKGKYYSYEYDKATGELKIWLNITGKKIESIDGASWKNVDAGSLKVDSIQIQYATTITDWPDDTLSQTYKNKVKWNGYTAEAERKYTRDVIGKSGTYNGDDGTLSYVVTVNPDGSKLANGGLLTLTDTFDNQGKSFELDSVALYTLDEDGNPAALTDPGLTLLTSGESPSAYTYSYTPDKDGNTQTIAVYLPDETPCALVYTYKITSSLTQDTSFTNTAVLTGNGNTYQKSETETIKSTDNWAETSTEALGTVTLIKRDSTSYTKKLSGAEFTVYKWVPGATDNEKGTWETVYTGTTGGNGMVTFGSLKPNTLYRITETATPEDYGLVAGWENRYIAFAVEDADGNLVTTDIDALVADAKADGESITSTNYALVNLNEQTTYRYDNWPNKPGETSIKIEKIWVDSNGNSINRSTADKLKVDLYRQEVDYESGKNNVCLIPDDSATLNGITTQSDYAAYKASHTCIGTYDISYVNGSWSLTINGLPKFSTTDGKMYQYYVVESECVPDSGSEVISVTYAIPTSDGTANGTVVKNTIQITNTLSSSSYTLPKTGGAGTPLEQIERWLKNLFTF